jgi:hypothetical protein
MRFMALAVRCSAAGVLSLPPPQAASTKLRASGSPSPSIVETFPLIAVDLEDSSCSIPLAFGWYERLPTAHHRGAAHSATKSFRSARMVQVGERGENCRGNTREDSWCFIACQAS